MIERDGWRFVVPLWLICLLSFVLFLAIGSVVWLAVGVIGLFLAAFVTYFFRDPDRTPPVGDDLILSPGDGKVLIVEERRDSDGKPFQLVSIFLSVFDVHVNRVPVSGEVTHLRHIPGKFHRAYLPEAVTENERTQITIRSDRGQISFSQVAGILARRIVCRLRQGEKVHRGERFGLIRFGSRIDLFLDRVCRSLCESATK